MEKVLIVLKLICFDDWTVKHCLSSMMGIISLSWYNVADYGSNEKYKLDNLKFWLITQGTTQM